MTTPIRLTGQNFSWEKTKENDIMRSMASFRFLRYPQIVLRWRDFWLAYPRMATGAAVLITALLLADIVLIYNRVQYSRELTRLRAAMTEVERSRVDAIMASEENHLALAIELARREALGDNDLHLVVDTRRELMYLERDGARLREMHVRRGPEAAIGTPPDTVHLVTPLGKRSVVLIVDESYRWTAPDWVYSRRGLQPGPDNRLPPGGLGPVAIFLEGGVIIYSRPKIGPLNDENYILPGSFRAEAADLEAIRENLNPGMAVYFY